MFPGRETLVWKMFPGYLLCDQVTMRNVILNGLSNFVIYGVWKYYDSLKSRRYLSKYLLWKTDELKNMASKIVHNLLEVIFENRLSYFGISKIVHTLGQDPRS